MAQYIDKSALVAETERRKNICQGNEDKEFTHLYYCGKTEAYSEMAEFINTLEVKDPYITCIQYTDRESAIKAQAEDYSFNIESELFNQLTKEQQALWRKEIEQACISGGYSGYLLARDPRYKESLEVREVDLDIQTFAKEMDSVFALPSCETKNTEEEPLNWEYAIAKHFFELGLKAQKGE